MVGIEFKISQENTTYEARSEIEEIKNSLNELEGDDLSQYLEEQIKADITVLDALRKDDLDCFLDVISKVENVWDLVGCYIGTLPTEEIVTIFDGICLLSGDESKQMWLEVWFFIEQALDAKHKEELIPFIFAPESGPFSADDLAFRLLLIQDPSMRKSLVSELLNVFIKPVAGEDVDDVDDVDDPVVQMRADCIDFFSFFIKDAGDEFAWQFMELFFEQTSSEWVKRIIIEGFDGNDPRASAYLFFSMNEDCKKAVINYLWDNKESIEQDEGTSLQKLLEVLFDMEKNAEKRSLLIEFVKGVLGQESFTEFACSAIANGDTFFAYAYLALDDDAISRIADFLSEDVLLRFAPGTLKERAFFMEALLLKEAQRKSFFNCSFEVGDDDFWSFELVKEVFQEASAETLLGEKGNIQKIPSIIIGLATRLLNENEFVLRLVPFLSDKQLIAYAENIPANWRETLLNRHMEALRDGGELMPDQISADGLAIVLTYMIGRTPFIKAPLQQLLEKMQSLKSDSIKWLEDGSKSKGKGFLLANEMRQLQTHFLKPFVMRNKKSFADLKSYFSEFLTLGREVEKAARELGCEAVVEDDEMDLDEPFSEGFSMLFTPPVLKLFKIENFEDLAKFGICCDQDFNDLGLSWQQRSRIEAIQKSVQVLCGNQGSEVESFWRPLFDLQGIEDAVYGEILEKRLYEALVLQIFKEESISQRSQEVNELWPKFREIVGQIAGNFSEFKSSIKYLSNFNEGAGPSREGTPSQKEAMMKETLQECIKFVRTHQFNYVVYQHIAKKRGNE